MKLPRSYFRKRWEGFMSVNQEGVLEIEGRSVEDLARKHGTPLYLMVEREIRSRARRFRKAFSGYPIARPQFAAKCNSNLEILRILREEGFELDCSSVGEIILGLLADYRPRQMTFTNLYKTEQDIHFAAQVGVQFITADSLEEIERISTVGRKLRKQIRTTIRINPMVQLGHWSTRQQQYGIPLAYAKSAIDLARKSPFVDFVGLHFHGGYLPSARAYQKVLRRLFPLLRYARDHGMKVRCLDLGGGFPVDVGENSVPTIEEIGPRVTSSVRRMARRYGFTSLQLILEPGKFIVQNAGVGLVRIISKKRLGMSHRLVVTDGATYSFLPDILFYKTRYDVLPATKMRKPRVHTLSIAGNTCDCIDILAHRRSMPKLATGDLLAFMDIGGYSSVIANNFNTLKRPPMILIHPDGSAKLIRRRDRFSEMFAPELDVLKVAGPNELERYSNLHRVNIDKIWKGMRSWETNGRGNGNGRAKTLTQQFQVLESVSTSKKKSQPVLAPRGA